MNNYIISSLHNDVIIRKVEKNLNNIIDFIHNSGGQIFLINREDDGTKQWLKLNSDVSFMCYSFENGSESKVDSWKLNWEEDNLDEQ